MNKAGDIIKQEKMKVIFWGTPEYVLPVAEALDKQFNRGREKQLVGVVTQTPKPAGRQKWLAYSPIDKWAYQKKITVYYEPNKVPEADLGVLAAYGEIIPKAVIDKFKHGILNVHPSLLPKWRGASPVQAAIIAGEPETGVSVIKLDEKLDHGAIVSSFREKISDTDTTEALRERLFIRSGQFLINLIPNYINKKIQLKEQDHTSATFSKTITKKDGYIQPQILEAAVSNSQFLISNVEVGFIKDYSVKPDVQFVDRFIRTMWPWPIAWSLLRLSSSGQAKRLKILKARVEEERLVLEEVQVEGKNPVSWEQFKDGYPEAKLSA